LESLWQKRLIAVYERSKGFSRPYHLRIFESSWRKQEPAKIQIFNGRSRGLGQDAQHAIYVQVSVALRQHLHHFKGAQLGVFLAIALHSNADGWAWPSMAVLKAETGYNVQTIAQALRDLCALTIDGQHVLLAVQDRAAGGTFATNRYLLFPSDADVACYAGEADDPQAAPPLDVPQTAAPSSKKPSTVQPDTVRPSSEKAHERSTIRNKNQREEEPESVRALHAAPSAARETGAGPPTEHPANAAYRAAFGKSPTDRQAAAIADAVTDITRWTRVLDDWHANAWRAESVGKMLDRYHHQDQEYRHAPPAHQDAVGRAGRPSAAPTPEELARFLSRPRAGLGQHGT
jgi:hypothetical protein